MLWKSKHREQFNRYTKERREKIRRKVIAAYGGKCTCCGEVEFVFLTIEHLNKDGNKHRRDCGGSLGTYTDAIRLGYPNSFTILCMNCNFAKRYSETCPHQTAKSALALATEGAQ